MAVDLGSYVSSPSLLPLRFSSLHSFPSRTGRKSSRVNCRSTLEDSATIYSTRIPSIFIMKRSFSGIPRSSDSSPEGSLEESKSSEKEKVPFGYSRKDVLLIGLGITIIGVGLKSGLEFIGVDSLQAGNAVQLIIVLGLTVGWIASYMFRVANKDMTYAQQLKDYESQVMQKRLDGLTEAELEALLEQVEEENTRIASGKRLQ